MRNCHVYKFTLNSLRDRNQNCASKSGKEGFNSLQNLSTHKFSVPKGTALHGRCKRQLWRSAFNLTELDHNFTIQRRLGFDWAYFFVLNWQTRAETKCATMLQQAEGKRCIHRLSRWFSLTILCLKGLNFLNKLNQCWVALPITKRQVLLHYIVYPRPFRIQTEVLLLMYLCHAY